MRQLSSILVSWLVAGAILLPPAFSQKVRTARRVVVSRASGSYLGIGVVDIDPERAKALKLKEVRGVEIKSVEDDSPAAKAGLKDGDAVLEYDGQAVANKEQFARLVRETTAGKQVKLQIWRNGAPQTVTAAIGTRTGGYSIQSDDGGGFAVTMPPMPPMPDMPRMGMTWRSAALGIESEALTSQLAEFFGVKEGVLVRSVIKDSPADKAGMKAGDVILKVDDSKVTSPREITSVLRSLRTKRTVPVVVMRKQQETTLTVTFEERRGMQQIGPLRDMRYC